MTKHTVMYTALEDLVEGYSAHVQAVAHPRVGDFLGVRGVCRTYTGWVWTSRVQWISPEQSQIGPKFETENTLYVPMDWLDLGVIEEAAAEPSLV